MNASTGSSKRQREGKADLVEERGKGSKRNQDAVDKDDGDASDSPTEEDIVSSCFTSSSWLSTKSTRGNLRKR